RRGRIPRRIRRAPFQRLHRGPRHLWHGVVPGAVDRRRGDLPRDRDGDRAPGRSACMKAPALAAIVVSGALFGLGLAVSTMVEPEIVRGFLLWKDMGLLLVLGGAVVVTTLAYHLAPRLIAKPWLAAEFQKHPSEMSARTLGGAAIFGVGWGLS